MKPENKLTDKQKLDLLISASMMALGYLVGQANQNSKHMRQFLAKTLKQVGVKSEYLDKELK